MSLKNQIQEYVSELGHYVNPSLEIIGGNFSIRLDLLFELVHEIGGTDQLKFQKPAKIAHRLNLDYKTIEHALCVPILLKSVYNTYLRGFEYWRQKDVMRKSLRKNSHNGGDETISKELGSIFEKKLSFFGPNSIYSSLASGLPNEINATLIVLLQMTSEQNEIIETLSKTKSLFILLPAVVGILYESEKTEQWSYLLNIPEIKKHADYIEIHSLKSSGNSEKHQLTENYAHKSIRFRFFQVLQILSNLLQNKRNLKINTSVIKLLLKCINSDLENLSLEAFSTLEIASHCIIINEMEKQYEDLQNSLYRTLNGGNRAKIIYSLKIIINIMVNNTNLFSEFNQNLWNKIEIEPIFELITSFDSEIISLALSSLQALTIYSSFKPKSEFYIYLNSIIPFLKSSEFDWILDLDIPSEIENINPKSVSEDLKIWLFSKYKETKNHEARVLLFDIFSDCIENFREDYKLNEYLICLLEFFKDYTTLLKGTFEAYLTIFKDDFEMLEKILLYTTNIYVPFCSIESYRSKTVSDNPLKKLQILRIKRRLEENNRNYILSTFLCQDILFKKQNSENEGNYTEIGEKENMDINMKNILHHRTIAYIFSNLSIHNIHIKRYLKLYILDDLLEKFYSNQEIVKILSKIFN